MDEFFFSDVRPSKWSYTVNYDWVKCAFTCAMVHLIWSLYLKMYQHDSNNICSFWQPQLTLKDVHVYNKNSKTTMQYISDFIFCIMWYKISLHKFTPVQDSFWRKKEIDLQDSETTSLQKNDKRLVPFDYPKGRHEGVSSHFNPFEPSVA